MSTAELKLDLFRRIDALDGKNLDQVYGFVLNLLNAKEDASGWASLTKAQKDAIHAGIKELDDNLGKDHHEVIAKFRIQN